MSAATSDARPAPRPFPASPPLRLTRSGYASAEVQELVAEVQAEYVVRYGGPDESPVHPADFEPPVGACLLAHAGEDLVGMVALRSHGGDEDPSPGGGFASAEMKRLYVRAVHRRRGHARAILALAEQEALALGYRRLVLETGTEQPEAMALYAAEGYHPIPGFGHYCGASLSRCFAKVLAR